MNLLDVFTIGSKIIDRFIPDPKAKAEAQQKLFEAQQAGEFKQLDAQLQITLGQLQVNKAEAESTNVYASSWRPSCGYVCVAGLAYQFLLQPLLTWLSLTQHWPPPPPLDIGDLVSILTGMLGLSAMRTGEKLRGVATK